MVGTMLKTETYREVESSILWGCVEKMMHWMPSLWVQNDPSASSCIQKNRIKTNKQANKQASKQWMGLGCFVVLAKVEHLLYLWDWEKGKAQLCRGSNLSRLADSQSISAHSASPSLP